MVRTAESFTRFRNDIGKGKAAVRENKGEEENPVFAEPSFVTANRHVK